MEKKDRCETFIIFSELPQPFIAHAVNCVITKFTISELYIAVFRISVYIRLLHFSKAYSPHKRTS